MAKYLLKTMKIGNGIEGGDYFVESDWMCVDSKTIHTIDIFGKKFTDEKVIRCKDCAHWLDNGKTSDIWSYCSVNDAVFSSDEYCSRGKQK